MVKSQEDIVPGQFPAYKKKPILTNEERLEIFKDFQSGKRVTFLSKKYDRNVATIRKIINDATKLSEETATQSVVVSEGRQQTYLQDIQWAMSACGEWLRTGMHPNKCPNDKAWFLYIQATQEPKDFMAKASQAESKATEADSASDVKKACRKSIAEISALLERIGDSDEANEAIDICEDSEEEQGEQETADCDDVRPLREESGEDVPED